MILKNLGKERPICAVEDCDNPALVFMAGDFVCGDCCVEYENTKNKIIMEDLKSLKHGSNK